MAQSSKHTHSHSHTLAHTLPGCFSGVYFVPTRSSEASPSFPSGDLKLEFGLYRRKGRGQKKKKKKRREADLTDGVGAVNVAGRLGICLRGAQRCCWTSRERTKSPSHVPVPPPPPSPHPRCPEDSKDDSPRDRARSFPLRYVRSSVYSRHSGEKCVCLLFGSFAQLHGVVAGI